MGGHLKTIKAATKFLQFGILHLLWSSDLQNRWRRHLPALSSKHRASMKVSIILLLVAYFAAEAIAMKASIAARRSRILMPSHFRASPSSPRSRRQTTECDIISARAQCSSPSAQNYINAISKCGGDADAASIITDTEFNCRKNKKGQYCGEVSDTDYVLGNCSASSCSPGCINILREGDCCLNEPDGTYTQYFIACGIPLPSPCAKSRLRIPTITQDSSCSANIQVAAYCDSIQPIINSLDRDDACKNISDLFKNYCSTSRNGQYCSLELYSTGDSVGLRSLQAAYNECPSTSTCSLQCSSSLSFVKKTVGCCFQSWVNNSVVYAEYFNTTTIVDSRLWNECGIPSPSKCSAASKYVIYIFIAFLMASIAFLLSFWLRTNYPC